MKQVTIFDIEADGLLDTVSKIHCLSVYDGKSKHTTSYDRMRECFLNAEIIVGHNIVRYDIPVLERLLGITISARRVDTLALSWYLYPNQLIHGLEWWGEYFGVPKPEIDDWENLTAKQYIHRCNEDVKINTRLWQKMWKDLCSIYGNDEEKIWELIDYLTFKMDCAREQERSGWQLDVDKCKQSLDELLVIKEEKTKALEQAMPKVKVYAKRTRPAKPFKKDGTLSSTGARWFNLLRKQQLPEDYTGEVKEEVGEKEPNSNSTDQIKSWLYSLGWVPETFKITRNKETGDVKQTPQINLEQGAGICPSIRKLVDENPSLDLLDGLGVVSHRISILEGFLTNVNEEGKVEAQISGFTNTLRVKHKTVVNLPKVGKAYGDIIRGVLIAPEGYELCGSDMASLEDRLKQHYIFPYDPDYVNEMNTPDYDPHLSLALSAGEADEEQVRRYKAKTDLSIKPVRDLYKTVNYACQYGAGGPRISMTAGVPLSKGKALHQAYWKKNWAIKKVAEDQYIKRVDGQMWLLNPVNGFFYSLRYEKDIFSTLVQGTASYVFDIWVREFRTRRPQLTAQFHDEVVLCIKKGYREQANSLLQWAITKVNSMVKLNRELAVDVQFGARYSEIH